MKKIPKIVCIGGGTGTYTVLTGLKKYPCQLYSIVTMADTGGSAKKERDEFGVLPSSDIRKSLVALAEASSEKENLLRELFQFRFDQGRGIKGMTFGNLFLVALTKLLGSQTEAIKKAGRILRIKGQVIPVSLDKVDLVATYENGLRIVGEHFIDEPKHDINLRLKKLATTPVGKASPEAVRAIKEADLIILGPGGFYTTLIANLVIKDIPEAIKKSRAKKIYVLNLMTEPGQTTNFSASECIKELGNYLGPDSLDFVLINDIPIPKPILVKYQESGASPVVDDLPKHCYFKVIRADLLSPKEIKRAAGDTLMRSLVRHDADKLAEAVMKLI